MRIFEWLGPYLKISATPVGVFQLVSSALVFLAVLAIFLSVAINFIEADNSRRTVKEKKSVVETSTMTLFFIVYYLVVRFRIGTITVSQNVQIALIIIGLLIIIIGCLTNILGRFSLGRNWANQIKVYDGHSLVRSGAYRYVRHPLYASLIWMFFGGSLVYLNYSALLLNVLIFIPFMYYRAKQEEAELSSRFKEYGEYAKQTGMFFPKLALCRTKNR